MAAKRRSIDIEGIGHANPIPFATRVGKLVFSGGIMGQDPATGKVAPTAEEQAAFIFQHIRTVMEQAGGSPDDIGHVTVFLQDMNHRGLINEHWVQMFPDPHSRPTRHTQPMSTSGPTLMQCQIIAVLE